MAKIQWEEALAMERDVAILLQKQAEKGIYFNTGKAKYFLSLLDQYKDNKYEEIRPYLDYNIINKESKNTKYDPTDLYSYPFNYVKKLYLKNGEYTASVINHYDDPSIVYGPFSRIEIEEPSISKRQLITNQLLKHGWKPTEFTEKGTPQLTIKGEPVDSLLEIGDFGKALADWYIYNHRQSQIQGFIELVRPDGRISSVMNGLTNTFRHKHKGVANIPRPTSVFGKEMRELFTVAPDRDFVGADASGLELRILAHHMNDAEYTKQILEGDIHLYNLSKTGKYITSEIVDMSNIKSEKKRLADARDTVKTWMYGFIYGSGDAKSGSIIGGTASDGKKLKETFFEELPALKRLIDKVQSFANKYGFVPSIDRRKIYIREFEGRIMTHTALNALLQANGSIVVKRAMIIANEEIRRRNLDAFQIIFYHDEFAFDCNKNCSEEVGQILVESMRKAGEYYNLNIPIDGEYGIGRDWSIH